MITTATTKEDREVCLVQDAQQIKEILVSHPEIVLFVIDPITDQTGEKALLSDPEMRKLLRSVQSRNVANVIVGHLNKKLGLSALQRVGRATAFIALSRAAWLFATDATRKEQHRMLPLKNNYAASPGPSFQIEVTKVKIAGELEPMPRIKWGTASDVDATDILDTRANAAEAKDSAVEFLRKFLWDGPRKQRGQRRLRAAPCCGR